MDLPNQTLNNDVNQTGPMGYSPHDQHVGMDPDSSQHRGQDPRPPQHMAQDPRPPQHMAQDPRPPQHMGQDPRPPQHMGQDPRPPQHMGQDPHSPQRMGQDPRPPQHMAQDPHSPQRMGQDPRPPQHMGQDPHASYDHYVVVDPHSPQHMGQDSRLSHDQYIGMDPHSSQPMGHDPRPPQHMAQDPRPPQHMGQDPRPPQHMGHDLHSPQHMAQDPRPPQHMAQDPRPPQHMAQDPRPPQHMAQDSRPPPHMAQDPRPPQHMAQDPRPPQHMAQDPRPPQHTAQDSRPPQHMGHDLHSSQHMGQDSRSSHDQYIGMDPCSSQHMGQDPRSSQHIGHDLHSSQHMGQDSRSSHDEYIGMDPRSSQHMDHDQDPRPPQHMGQDPRSSQHMGQDPRSSQHMGQDPRSSQHMGQDPHSPQHMAQDPRSSQHMGQDPRSPQHMAQDPCSPQHMAQDPCSPQHTAQDPHSSQHMGQDPRSSQYMAQDPRSSQHMGQDPRPPQHMGQDPRPPQHMGQDPRPPQHMGQDPRPPQHMGQDPRSPQHMGQDPRSPQHMGQDPRPPQHMGQDPRSPQHMGQDPRSPKHMGQDPHASHDQYLGMDPHSSQHMGQDPRSSQYVGHYPPSSQQLRPYLNTPQHMSQAVYSPQNVRVNPHSPHLDPHSPHYMGQDPHLPQHIEQDPSSSYFVECKPIPGSPNYRESKFNQSPNTGLTSRPLPRNYPYPFQYEVGSQGPNQPQHITQEYIVPPQSSHMRPRSPKPVEPHEQISRNIGQIPYSVGLDSDQHQDKRCSSNPQMRTHQRLQSDNFAEQQVLDMPGRSYTFPSKESSQPVRVPDLPKKSETSQEIESLSSIKESISNAERTLVLMFRWKQDLPSKSIFLDYLKKVAQTDLEEISWCDSEHTAFFSTDQRAVDCFREAELTCGKCEVDATLVPHSYAVEDYDFCIWMGCIPKECDREQLEGFVETSTNLSHHNGDFYLFLEQQEVFIFFEERKKGNISTFRYKLDRQKKEISPSIIIKKLKQTNILKIWHKDEQSAKTDTPMALTNFLKWKGIELKEPPRTLPDENSTLMELENPKNLKKARDVLTQQLGKSIARVEPFFEMIDETRKQFQGSSLTVTQTVSKNKALFIDKMEQLKQFNVHLQQIQAFAYLNDNRDMITVKAQGYTQGLDGTSWRKEVDSEIGNFLSGISEVTLPLEDEHVADMIKTMLTGRNDIYYIDEGNTIMVTGSQETTELILSQVKDQNAKNKLVSEKCKVNYAKAIFIENFLMEDLRGDFRKVNFKIYTKECKLELKAPEKYCKEFIQRIESLEIFTEDSGQPQEMLQHLCGRPYGGKQIDDAIAFSGQKRVTYLFADQDLNPVQSEDAHIAKLVLVSDTFKAVQLMKTELGSKFIVRSVPIPDDFDALAGLKWEEKREEIEDEHSVTILKSLNEIKIAGQKSDVKKTIRNMNDYISEITTANEKIPLQQEQWMVMSLTGRWKDITKSVKESGLKCEQPDNVDEDPVITITGDRQKADMIRRSIAKLRDSIESTIMSIQRPGATKFFCGRSIQGRRLIEETALRSNAKAITGPKKRNNAQRFLPGTLSSSQRVVCLGNIVEGVELAIIVGDITEMEVDVVVNAANVQLQHGGGVAGALSRKAGSIFQDESNQYVMKNGQLSVGQAIILTGVGRLACKAIAHAVGPQWQGAQKNEKLLERAVMNSLTVASEYCSIAFPAISTGIYGCPKDICSKVMFQAFKHFFNGNPNSKLKKVDIVLISNEDARFFIDEAENYLIGLKKVTTSHSFRTEASTGAFTGGHTSQNFADYFFIQRGKLSECKADALVNSSNGDLDLTQGIISKSLSAAAGATLQNECNGYTAKHGKLKYGEVAMTGAGNLKAKYVIHTSIKEYKSHDPSSYQTLESSVKKALELCSKRRLSSIAFPTLGMGILLYPPKEVARLIFGTANDYFKKYHNSTSLKKVIIVIFDGSVVPIFEDAKQRYAEGSRVVRDVTVNPSRSRSTAFAPQLNIDVVQGDITDEDCDAIVNSTNPTISLEDFGVMKALKQKGGSAFQEICTRAVKLHGNIPKGGVLVTTSPSTCRFRHIIHTVAPDDLMADLPSTICTILNEADNKGFTSIAIPAIGTGNRGFATASAAEAFAFGVKMFESKHISYLKHVRIVIYQRNMYDSFSKVFQQKRESSSSQSFGKQPKSLLGKAASYISKKLQIGSDNTLEDTDDLVSPEDLPPIPPPSPEDASLPPFGTPVEIEIYAETKQQLEEVQNNILTEIQSYFVKKDFNENSLINFPQQYIHDLIEAGRKTHLKIEFDDEVCTLDGLKNDVQKFESTIQEAIGLVRSRKKALSDAQALSKSIKWMYYDEAMFTWEEYDFQTNYRIETAKKNGKDTVTVPCHGGQSATLYFQKLEAVIDRGFFRSNKSISVKRFDSSDRLPEHWDTMKPGQQYVKVVLKEASREYNEITQFFEKTMCARKTPSQFMQVPWSVIVTVERIQSPLLLSNFLNCKDRVDANNPGNKNERRLFHGCKGAVCDSINVTGFNRSFAADNIGARFGNGSYFAVEANYSARDGYSAPDTDTGHKHIYVVRVLTGRYTTGKQGMKTPPPIDPSTPLVLYDSVTDDEKNPGMFVVFNDNYAYPEYLITFK